MPRKSKWSWAGAAAKGVVAGVAGWARSRLGGGAKKATALSTRRKVGSKTKVLRQRKFSSGVLKGPGAVSFFKGRPGKLNLSKSILSNISGRNQYVFNMSQRLTSADGRQNATSVIYWDSYPVNQMLNSIAPGAANNTKRMLCKQSFHEYTISNASNATCYISLYDVYYRRDLEVVSDPSVLFPHYAWNNGEIQEGNTLGYSMIGSYPTRISQFGEYYAVAKKTTHMLGPGEVHKHKVLLTPNKWITKNLATEKDFYRGLTAATLFVVQGTPVDNGGSTLVGDASGGINAEGVITEAGVSGFGVNSTVTTSPCAVNMIYQARYQFQWVDDIDSDITTSNGLPTGVSGLDVMAPTCIPYTVVNT